MSGKSAKTWRERNPDKALNHRRRMEEKRKDGGYYRDYYRRPGVAIKRQLIQAKNRAEKQGVPFDIELEDIIVPEVCPVLGMKLEQGGRGNPSSPSLDKLIPSLGYVKGNVRVISARANSLKNNATLEELRAIVAYMEREIGEPL